MLRPALQRLCLLACGTTSPLALADSYALVIDPGHPLTGELTLSFDAPAKTDARLKARLLPTANQVTRVQCLAPKAELEQEEGLWIVPEGCRSVGWSVKFVEAGSANYAVSRQENLYHPKGWWVLSEWGSVLRRSSTGGEPICVTVGTQDEFCRTLPPVEQPPLLLTFGQPDQVQHVGGFNFRVFSDQAENLLDTKSVLATFDHQLNTLLQVMGPLAQPPQNSTIDIVWLAIHPSHGVSSGAAGIDSLLANYVTNENGDNVSNAEQTRLLWVSAHEILHLLGINTNTIWASESLPTYYAFKSFAGRPEADTANDFFAQMEQESNGSVGLLTAHARVLEGQGQYMAVIYAKGAVFWREVDEGIQDASHGQQKLADFLPSLVLEPFAEDGTLPAAFQASIREKVPAFDLDELTRRFL